MRTIDARLIEEVEHLTERAKARADRGEAGLRHQSLLSAAEAMALGEAVRSAAMANEWEYVRYRLTRPGATTADAVRVVAERLGRLGTASTNPMQAIVDAARASALAEVLDVLTARGKFSDPVSGGSGGKT